MREEKLRLCLIEQFCQEVKHKSALSNPEDWILRYIRILYYLVGSPADINALEVDHNVLVQIISYIVFPCVG